MAAGKMNPAIILTGAANQGKTGPPMGVVDIGISDKAYLCRVLLPRFRNNQGDVAYEITEDGTVTIRGTVHRPGIPADHKMIVQELSQSGKFNICFSLPGPVDPRLVQPELRSDGILELVVFKLMVNPAV